MKKFIVLLLSFLFVLPLKSSDSLDEDSNEVVIIIEDDKTTNFFDLLPQEILFYMAKYLRKKELIYFCATHQQARAIFIDTIRIRMAPRIKKAYKNLLMNAKREHDITKTWRTLVKFTSLQDKTYGLLTNKRLENIKKDLDPFLQHAVQYCNREYFVRNDGYGSIKYLADKFDIKIDSPCLIPKCCFDLKECWDNIAYFFWYSPRAKMGSYFYKCRGYRSYCFCGCCNCKWPF